MSNKKGALNSSKVSVHDKGGIFAHETEVAAVMNEFFVNMGK